MSNKVKIRKRVKAAASSLVAGFAQAGRDYGITFLRTEADTMTKQIAALEGSACGDHPLVAASVRVRDSMRELADALEVQDAALAQFNQEIG